MSQVERRDKCEVLWNVLCAIERSILPRTIQLKTRTGRLEIDAVGGRMLNGPRLDPLSGETDVRLEGHDASSTGAHGATVGNGYDGLLYQTACALANLTSQEQPVTYSVRALRPVDPSLNGEHLPVFTALELARSFASVLLASASGPVASYYRKVAGTFPDAWLVERSGRPAGIPEHVSSLQDVVGCTDNLVGALSWRHAIEPIEGAVFAILTPASRQCVRCLAIDDEHIAFLSGKAERLGTMFASWRGVEGASGAANRPLT